MTTTLMSGAVVGRLSDEGDGLDKATSVFTSSIRFDY
jgi:hypothetical protein